MSPRPLGNALRAFLLGAATLSTACLLPAESEPDDEDDLGKSEQAMELWAIDTRSSQDADMLSLLVEPGADQACDFVTVPEPDLVIDAFAVEHELYGLQAGGSHCERFVIEVKGTPGDFRWLKVSNAAVPMGMCGGGLDHGFCADGFVVRAELWKRSCEDGSCSPWELQVFDPVADELQCNGLHVAECDLMYRGYVSDADDFNEFRLALKAERRFDDEDVDDDWFVDVGLYRDRPDRRKL